MTILCYHAVDPSWTSPLSMPPARFASHCRWLQRHRQVVDLDTAVAQLGPTWCLPRGMAAITFDDGFASLYDHAFPVLHRLGLPATVFIVAETLTAAGRAVDWVIPPPVVPPPTLTLEQILEMQEGGISFQSHSFSHRDLPGLSDDECERDLRASRELLEDALGRSVTHLAYPRGLHDERVRRAAARAGYERSFALPEQAEVAGPHAIPRIGIYPQNGTAVLRAKTAPVYLSLRTGRAFGAIRPAARALRAVALRGRR